MIHYKAMNSKLKKYYLQLVRFDTLLLKRGLAKPWDSSRCQPLPLPQITITNEDTADDSDATLESPVQIERVEETKCKKPRSNSKKSQDKKVLRSSTAVEQTA